MSILEQIYGEKHASIIEKIKEKKERVDEDEKLVRANSLASFGNNNHHIEHLHLYSASCTHFHFTFLIRKNEKRKSYEFGLLFLNLKKFFIFETSKIIEIQEFLEKKVSFLDEDEFLVHLKEKYEYEITI